MRGEREVLDKLRRRISIPKASGVVLGIGDDCAIVRSPGAREDLLFTTDMLIENVHFLRQTHAPADIGHKTLARGLSDIAAMGGSPRFCLLSLALPEWADDGWVEGFHDGLLDLANRTGTALAGGDLARSERLTCDIVVCGAVPPGGALLRSGARPGDAIYVSGLLGEASLGFETRRGKPWKKHLRPEPRIEAGRFAREQLKATAAMDLSDGLSLDLHRLCLASGVSANLDDAPPHSRMAKPRHYLHGGEDYELLFTVPRNTPVPAEIGGVPLTRIGAIEKGTPGVVRIFGLPLPALGYDHFRKP